MELIKWRDAYNTGIGMFDEEHRCLVTMINRLYTALREGKEETVVKAILEELINYTREHFAHEEELMERHGYPELDAHRFEHNSFRSTIRDLSRMVNQGIDGLGRPLLQMLRDWLMHHIQEVDARYGRFFSEQEL
ncbi:hemerythrin [Geothermobacter ehrlichii]|uniref:Hemerythrin n=1 Tax=Geothermobacter ehrlichii TaxID=213224 RepID=A0A5D3WN65_9BACT|nr:bacteriohemerythrin [Geothermobacter ehrlichii]TYO99665.1 hemerythrin [Geothermobacter ehrlichii]